MNIATQISSAISAYARIGIHTMKNEFTKNGCGILYSDTDSTYISGIINKRLSKYMNKDIDMFKIERSGF